jgi:predicted secreted hydrolase
LLIPSADGVQPDHPSQWWYWSGQLRGASGRRYGLQAAFFAAEAVRGLLWGQMAHWALIDLDASEFRSGSRVWLGAPRRIEGRFELTTPAGEVSAIGGDGLDRLCLRLGDLTLDVTARDEHVVPHYDGRRHDYAFGGYTYYYSRPRMLARGTLRRGARAEPVAGDLWFDRQYGALSSALLAGVAMVLPAPRRRHAGDDLRLQPRALRALRGDRRR